MNIYNRGYYRKIAENIECLLRRERNGAAFLESLAVGCKPNSGDLSYFLCEASRSAKHRIGGQAFGDWNAGLYRDGVWVHVTNHEFYIAYAPSPLCDIKRGCQESCAHGNPTPQLFLNGEKVKWISRDELPKSSLSKVDSIARELFVEATDAVLKACARWDEEAEKQRKVRRVERDKIEEAWK